MYDKAHGRTATDNNLQSGSTVTGVSALCTQPWNDLMGGRGGGGWERGLGGGGGGGGHQLFTPLVTCRTPYI